MYTQIYSNSQRFTRQLRGSARPASVRLRDGGPTLTNAPYACPACGELGIFVARCDRCGVPLEYRLARDSELTLRRPLVDADRRLAAAYDRTHAAAFTERGGLELTPIAALDAGRVRVRGEVVSFRGDAAIAHAVIHTPRRMGVDRAMFETTVAPELVLRDETGTVAVGVGRVRGVATSAPLRTKRLLRGDAVEVVADVRIVDVKPEGYRAVVTRCELVGDVGRPAWVFF